MFWNLRFRGDWGEGEKWEGMQIPKQTFDIRNNPTPVQVLMSQVYSLTWPQEAGWSCRECIFPFLLLLGARGLSGSIQYEWVCSGGNGDKAQSRLCTRKEEGERKECLCLLHALLVPATPELQRKKPIKCPRKYKTAVTQVRFLKLIFPDTLHEQIIDSLIFPVDGTILKVESSKIYNCFINS